MDQDSDDAPRDGGEHPDVASLDLPLDRGRFMASLGVMMTSHLERVVGRVETDGYVSGVGAEMGEQVSRLYVDALAEETLPKPLVADVLVDLKRRIGGEFTVAEETADGFVLENARCPFGQEVQGRPSLCMVTSNVFGVIASDAAGYARVTLEKTIAEGHGRCRVCVSFNPDERECADAERDRSRDYYKP